MGMPTTISEQPAAASARAGRMLDVPQCVPVSINGFSGLYVVQTQNLVCHCKPCISKVMPQYFTPTEFERHAGMGSSKKWKRTIKVVLPGKNPVHLGGWLEAAGLVKDSEVPRNPTRPRTEAPSHAAKPAPLLQAAKDAADKILPMRTSDRTLPQQQQHKQAPPPNHVQRSELVANMPTKATVIIARPPTMQIEPVKQNQQQQHTQGNPNGPKIRHVIHQRVIPHGNTPVVRVVDAKGPAPSRTLPQARQDPHQQSRNAATRPRFSTPNQPSRPQLMSQASPKLTSPQRRPSSLGQSLSSDSLVSDATYSYPLHGLWRGLTDTAVHVPAIISAGTLHVAIGPAAEAEQQPDKPLVKLPESAAAALRAAAAARNAAKGGSFAAGLRNLCAPTPSTDAHANNAQQAGIPRHASVPNNPSAEQPAKPASLLQRMFAARNAGASIGSQERSQSPATSQRLPSNSGQANSAPGYGTWQEVAPSGSHQVSDWSGSQQDVDGQGSEQYVDAEYSEAAVPTAQPDLQPTPTDLLAELSPIPLLRPLQWQTAGAPTSAPHPARQTAPTPALLAGASLISALRAASETSGPAKNAPIPAAPSRTFAFGMRTQLGEKRASPDTPAEGALFGVVPRKRRSGWQPAPAGATAATDTATAAQAPRPSSRQSDTSPPEPHPQRSNLAPQAKLATPSRWRGLQDLAAIGSAPKRKQTSSDGKPQQHTLSAPPLRTPSGHAADKLQTMTLSSYHNSQHTGSIRPASPSGEPGNDHARQLQPVDTQATTATATGFDAAAAEDATLASPHDLPSDDSTAKILEEYVDAYDSLDLNHMGGHRISATDLNQIGGLSAQLNSEDMQDITANAGHGSSLDLAALAIQNHEPGHMDTNKQQGDNQGAVHMDLGAPDMPKDSHMTGDQSVSHLALPSSPVSAFGDMKGFGSMADLNGPLDVPMGDMDIGGEAVLAFHEPAMMEGLDGDMQAALCA